jgi:hypothetical protein
MPRLDEVYGVVELVISRGNDVGGREEGCSKITFLVGHRGKSNSSVDRS